MAFKEDRFQTLNSPFNGGMVRPFSECLRARPHEQSPWVDPPKDRISKGLETLSLKHREVTKNYKAEGKT
jgi:hypothetical protein